MPLTHAEKEAEIQTSEDQVVNVKKSTTKVNLWVVIAVLAFFAFAALTASWMWHHPEQATNSLTNQMKVP